jgi:protein-S-isoprenylcysteine O-methyltransferase Ste14
VQAHQDKRGPGLKFPPPLLPLSLIGIGHLSDTWLPLPVSESVVMRGVGIALIAVALLLALVALFHFLRAKTHVEPWQPTTTIIQSGVFRYSRNPIYLAFCIATLGCGLLLNSWWVLMATVPLAGLLQLLVIRREEAYLEEKFGQSYLAYKRKVRRWI